MRGAANVLVRKRAQSAHAQQLLQNNKTLVIATGDPNIIKLASLLIDMNEKPRPKIIEQNKQ